MNAQKAIEMLQKELDELVDELSEESEYCNSGVINVSDDFEDRCDRRDALSIVLESARMFHEDIIDDVSPVYRGHIYLYDVNNQILTTLDVKEAKSIGIVGGADE